MHLQVLVADHNDVWRHLATEEQLMTELPANLGVLYLWVSSPSVVIGKNQNPWLECRVGEMTADGVCLARRLSGGGAVYHDLGNLNFSMIVHQDAYDRDAIADGILAAIRSFGIDAKVGARHILEVGDRKFSGNAFCIKQRKVIHHGTVLLSADLDRLHRYLRPSCAGIESKGIASVSSPVVNLTELRPDLKMPDIVSAIIEAFQPDETIAPPAEESLSSLEQQYQSVEWLYDRTPRFSVHVSINLTGQPVELCAHVAKGVITKVSTEPEQPRLNENYTGVRFQEFLDENPDLEIGND